MLQGLRFFCLLLVLCAVAPAQDAPQAGDLTVAEVQKRLSSLADKTTLTEEVLTEARTAYEAAIRALQDAARDREAKDQAEASAQNAPGEAERLREELKRALPEPSIAATRDSKLPELRGGLETAEAEEAAKAKVLESLREESKKRARAKSDLPGQIAALRAQIEAGQANLPQAAPPEEPARARWTKAEAELIRARASLAAREAEKTSYEKREELLPLRIKDAERRLEQAKKLTGLWHSAVDAATLQVARDAARNAERERAEAASVHAIAEKVAEGNTVLTQEISLLTAKTTRTKALNKSLRESATKILREEEDSKRRIQVVGLTDAVGVQLRRHRERLPAPAEIRDRLYETRESLEQVQDERFIRDEDINKLGSTSDEVAKLMKEVGPEHGEAKRQEIEAMLSGLIDSRRELLQLHLEKADECTLELIDREAEELKLLAVASSYAAFIDERVLWIRSQPPLWEVRASEFVDATLELIGLDGWEQTGRAWIEALGRWLQFAAAALGVFALFYCSQRLDRYAARPELQATKAVNFWATLAVLLSSVVSAVWLPTAMAIASVPLRQATAYSHPWALGAALESAALWWLLIGGLRELYRPTGLAEAHFGWHAQHVRVVRKQFRIFAWCALPSAMLFEFFSATTREGAHAASARVALMVLLAAFVILLAGLFNPHRGLLSPTIRGRDSGWLVKLRHFWFLLVMIVPFALIIMALLGYQYTAEQLVGRLKLTLAFAFGVALVNALAGRALVIARRRLRRKQREANAEAVSVDQDSGAANDAENIDVEALDAQSRQVLKAAVFMLALFGSYLIWVDVVPALGILQNVSLWDIRETVVESVRDSATGASRSEEVVRSVAITLSDMLSALLTMVFTVLATKNLPGLLEVVLLQRLPLQQSTRYAMTTLARYILAVFGTTLALGSLGIQWESIQWLVAAMSVGLGFGLQEIFGNFVSGLIILFERRVRVGDLVTIGDTTGTVRRVRVLATTVENFDRKELIVPNKNIITGTLLNWTLTNSLNRIVFTVGIAYGSDVSKALSIVEAAAKRHVLILEDPPPVVTFENFGDSSLNLTLRVYLAKTDYRLEVISAINDAIHSEFRDAGIEIPFPQRDLHVRDVPAGWLKPAPDSATSSEEVDR